MSDADPDSENGEPQQERPLTAAGIDPREVAAIARLTDVLHREGFEVSHIGGIGTTQFGIVADISVYHQTREPTPEELEAMREQAQTAEEAEAEAEGGDDPGSIVEEVGAEDGE